MQTSTPADGGETPWLLFVGILTMALVPALSSFLRLQEFDKRMGLLQAGYVEYSDMQNKVSSLRSLVENKLNPSVAKQLREVAQVEGKLAAVTAAQDEVRKAIEILDQQGHASAPLAKDVENAIARLDLIDRALGDRVTRDQFEQLGRDFVRGESLKAQLAQAAEAQKPEVAKAVAAAVDALKKSYDERLAKAAADHAALEQALAASKAQGDATAKQLAELAAKVDALAKAAEKPPEKAPETPPEPPKEPPK